MTRGRWKRFWTYLEPYRRSIVLLFSSILFTILVLLPVPWLEKIIIDRAIPARDERLLLWLVGGIIGLYAVYRIVLFGRNWLSIRVKQRVLTGVRMHMYEHLQRMGQGFFARHNIGNLLSRVVNDVGYVQNLMNDELFEVVSSAIKVFVVTGFLFWINWRLTLLCLCVLPVLALIFFLFKRRVYQENRRLQETQARLSGRIQQNFAGMKLIQAETIEDRMQAETLDASRQLEQVGIRREVVAHTGNLLTTLLSYAPMVGILWGVGGVMVMRGTLTLGELLAYTQYLFGMVGPVTRIFQFNMNLQAGYAALDRIYEILDEEPEIQDAPDARKLEPPIERLSFDNVGLVFGETGTETEINALHRVSFDLSQGEKVAIVGPSGAGKTSVINLLLRFHDPTSGEVRINGQPLSAYTLQSLRQQLAYVSQEVFLFGDTIRQNVTLGRDVSEDRLKSALELAQAASFVQDLDPDGGLESPVEEQGANFSGGQRQRLALARVLVRDTSLYLFDEATSALDAESEQRVLDGLRDFLENRTALIVAHRFSFLELVDRVLVFTEGRLVEDGTVAELLERRGVFWTLHQAQHAE